VAPPSSFTQQAPQAAAPSQAAHCPVQPPVKQSLQAPAPAQPAQSPTQSEPAPQKPQPPSPKHAA